MRVPANDKTLHVLGGVVSTSAGYALAAVARHHGCPLPRWAFAIGACALAALLREAYNKWRGGRWSNADIAATLIGSAPVMLAVEVS